MHFTIFPQVMWILTWTKIIILISLYAAIIHSSFNFNTWFITPPPLPPRILPNWFQIDRFYVYYRNTVIPYSDYDKWWCLSQCDGEECSVPPCSGFFRHRRSTSNCLAAGAWAGQTNMDTWCQNNCAIGYCPSSHCVCQGMHVWKFLSKNVSMNPVNLGQINIHKYYT